MFHYTTTLHPDLSFLLMERRPKSLQQKFNDAEDIEHSIQACKHIQNEELDAKNYIPLVKRRGGVLSSE
jgi:hypothetical protein